MRMTAAILFCSLTAGVAHAEEPYSLPFELRGKFLEGLAGADVDLTPPYEELAMAGAVTLAATSILSAVCNVHYTARGRPQMGWRVMGYATSGLDLVGAALLLHYGGRDLEPFGLMLAATGVLTLGTTAIASLKQPSTSVTITPTAMAPPGQPPAYGVALGGGF